MKTKVIGNVGAAFKETNYGLTMTCFSLDDDVVYARDIQLLIYSVAYT